MTQQKSQIKHKMRRTPDLTPGIRWLLFLATALTWASIGLAGMGGSPAQIVGSEDLAAETAKIRAEQQAAYDSLNKSNPLSTSFVNPLNSLSPGASGTATPPLLPFSNTQFETLNQFLSHPFFKKLIKLGSDPGFKTTLEQVSKSPHRTNLVYAEIGWFLFFMVFRAWLGFKLTDSRWFLKLLVRFLTMIAFFAGTSVLIPVLFMGEPYWNLLKHLVELFL